jgi:hypothetical protein
MTPLQEMVLRTMAGAAILAAFPIVYQDPGGELIQIKTPDFDVQAWASLLVDTGIEVPL